MKTCKKCGVERPESDYQTCKSAGKVYLRGDCRTCCTTFVKAWKEANPENAKKNRDASNARRRAKTALLSATFSWASDAAKLDLMRRAFVERPPNLSGEGEQLAYFRGYLAGAKRRGEETERFERLKDLPHRIASERASMRGIGYEEAISAAYEGLLVFMRGRGRHASLEDERRFAANSIRKAIIDYKRSEGPVRRAGGLRWIGDQDVRAEDGAGMVEDLSVAPASHSAIEEEDSWSEIYRRLEGVKDGERIGQAMRWRADGETLAEIGKRLGVTEARACQILRDAKPWIEENVLHLLRA